MEIKNIKDLKCDNLQELKINYEKKISDMIGNYSKSKLIYQDNIDN